MVFDYVMKYLQQLRMNDAVAHFLFEICPDGSGAFRQGDDVLWTFDNINDLADKLIKRVGGK